MFYFDNAATTYPKPEEVYKFTDEFYRNFGVNVGRGQFKESSISANIVKETRELLLDLFHCNATKEVIFTPSSTIAMNMILQGQDWNEGDVVYISKFEHNAVLRTLNFLQDKYKIIIKYIEPDRETLEYDFEQVQVSFQLDKPKLVIINHVSNSFGFIAPIEELCKISKEYNAKTVVDMSQSAGLIDTNILFCNIDYAIFAGHKTLYAPFGIAGFIFNKNDNLKPVLFGGTGVDSINKYMPKTVPERYEPGSLNIMAISGLNAALKWINNIGINNIYNKDIEYRNKLIKIFSQYSNIRILTNVNLKKQVGIISTVFDGYSCDNIGNILSKNNIAVRTGLHCAPESHVFMGTAPAGTVRFSISYFMKDSDFEQLDSILKYIEENS